MRTLLVSTIALSSLAVFAVSAISMAESAPPAKTEQGLSTSAPTPASSPGFPTPMMGAFGPKARNGLDDGFFDDKKESNVPGLTSGSGAQTQKVVSDTGRSYGADPDYTSDQREEWIKACEAQRQADPKAFRDCFENEKRKAQQALRERFDAVEKRQGQPLKNIPAPAPLMDDNRDPAGDE